MNEISPDLIDKAKGYCQNYELNELKTEEEILKYLNENKVCPICENWSKCRAGIASFFGK